MTGLECLIVDLVGIAEAPVYSTYRWLGRQLGRDVSLSEFLHVVGQAIERDVVRLWSIDTGSAERTELFSVPPDLQTRYESEPGLDDRYDPFGLSLTLGASADVDAEPEWKFRLDFDDQVFEITAQVGHEAEALEQLTRCYPELRPSVTVREEHGQVRRLVGTFSDGSRE